MIVEDIVFFQLGGIEVHVASGKIGIALVKQGLDHVDILCNAVGGRLYHIRALDVQLVAVGKEGICIEFCHFHNGFMLPGGALEHLVLAGIGIGRQVAYVCDIHDPLHTVAHITQALLQHILHNIGAQIADMGIVIDRGATGIHFDMLRVSGGKKLLLTGKRIVKVHGFFLLIPDK